MKKSFIINGLTPGSYGAGKQQVDVADVKVVTDVSLITKIAKFNEGIFLSKSGGTLTGTLSVASIYPINSYSTLGSSSNSWDSIYVKSSIVGTSNAYPIEMRNSYYGFRIGLYPTEMYDVLMAGDTIRPYNSGYVTLGTNMYRWAGVYSTLGNFSGTITSAAIQPTATNTYALGTSSLLYSALYVSTVNINTAITPITTNTVPIGTSSIRLSNIYSTLGNFSGTITSAAIQPTATNTYALGTSSLLYSALYVGTVNVNTAITPITTNTVPIGTSSIRLSNIYSTLGNFSGTITSAAIQPTATNTYALGTSSLLYSALYVGTVNVNTAITPITTNTVPIGTSSIRLSNIYSTLGNFSGQLTIPDATANTSAASLGQVKQYAASATTVTADYTTSTVKTVFCQGTLTVTLAIAGVDDGYEYCIFNETGTGTITINVSGGGTINGATTQTLIGIYKFLKLTKKGSNYLITGQ